MQDHQAPEDFQIPRLGFTAPPALNKDLILVKV